jgi:soluble lytic murein transglycosylase-like protein
MASKTGPVVFLLGALLLLASTSARAQIHTWRDANGNLVLSDRPRPGEQPVRSFQVPESREIRVTRFVSPERAAAFDGLIALHAGNQGVRRDLVRAVMQVESAFNVYARSPKGAMGLMQLMPATLREFGVGNPFDPDQNVRAGVAYLRQLLDRYGNNERLALAAYNAGPGAVDRYGQRVPPYRETTTYVDKVKGIAGQRERTNGSKIYRVVETVDGREVVRYTNQPGSSATR